MDMPATLFKYVTAERTDILKNGLIRFSALASLNDPFEARPALKSLAPSGFFEDKVSVGLPRALLERYNEAPPELRNLISADAFIALAMDNSASVLSELFAVVTPLLQESKDLFPQKIAENIGTLCLAESPSNILMWSHYSGNHSGFVIGFRTSHPFFNRRRTDNDELNHLRKVKYIDERPGGTMMDMDGEKIFLTKSSHWAYEQEWRMLSPLSDASSVINLANDSIHLFEFPLDSIESVTIGAKTSLTLREELLTLASNLGSVSVMQSSISAERYEICIAAAP